MILKLCSNDNKKGYKLILFNDKSRRQNLEEETISEDKLLKLYAPKKGKEMIIEGMLLRSSAQKQLSMVFQQRTQRYKYQHHK